MVTLRQGLNRWKWAACCAAGLAALPLVMKPLAMAKEPSGAGGRAAIAENTAQAALLRAAEAVNTGDESRRREYLDIALAAAPESAAVRGQLGYLRDGRNWVRVSEYVEAYRPPAAWKQYHDLRKQTPATVEGQTSLADFCSRQGLLEQERVHWSAVLDLDPDHAAARQRLNYERVGDQWVTPEEKTEKTAAAKAIVAAYREQHVRLEKLHGELVAGKKTVAQVAAELAVNHRAAIIPSWELLISAKSANGARAVVLALSEYSAPEASLSLVRHALSASPAEVRQSAVAALKTRDRNSFIPELLADLRTPVLASSSIQRGSGGRVFYHYELFADQQDRQQLAVFDHTFNVEGVKAVASQIAEQQARSSLAAREAVRDRQNQRIAATNARIMQLLTAVTNESNFDSPQDWITWWDDQNEVYRTGGKPLDQQRVTSTSQVAYIPPANYSSGPSIPLPSQATSECFAAGTPILTMTGPVAIERIRPGDQVLAQNPATGQLAFQPVLKTTTRAPEPLVRIRNGGETLRCTTGHPLWIVNQGWQLARDVKAGQQLHSLAGSQLIEAVETETELTKTFNLVVAGDHTYFAGANRVLTHDNSKVKAISAVLPGVLKP